MRQDSDSEVSHLEDNMTTLKARLAILETALAMPAKGTRTVNKQPDRERRAEVLYVSTLSVVFCAVMTGLIWASTRIPLLSVFSLVFCASFVIILLAVFDLSKAGKLSERSLMQVLRNAFKFMSRRNK